MSAFRSMRAKPLVLVAVAASAAVLMGGVSAAPATAGTISSGCDNGGAAYGGRWRPRPTTEPWQWQLQGKIDTSVAACVFEVDGFDVSAKTVAQLHRRGAKVVCYLDVGSWESYRPDRGEFPSSAIGSTYEGFPDERWLDVSRFHLFAKPLQQRFDMCARKGFDAVEPDNVAGWEPENHTGFAITRADQLRFNRWVARQVHRRHMSVALKNDGRQASQLLPSFDFAVVEQCFQYQECNLYRPFVAHDKAVFETEYEQQPSDYCAEALQLRFSALRKTYDLFARPWEPCRPATAALGNRAGPYRRARSST